MAAPLFLRKESQLNAQLHLDDQSSITLLHRVDARARRITLRYDRRTQMLVLTRPYGVSAEQALLFARKQSSWIKARLSEQPALVKLEPEQRLMLLGHERRLLPAKGALRSHYDQDAIYIAGSAALFSQNCLRFLRGLCAEDLKARCQDKAQQINQTISSITIRDQKTRWGSCSSRGNLAFSWRIIMAPDFVRDYLAAHEVAHLRHMNHSAAFWSLCESLTNGQKQGRVRAESWLRDHAKELQAVQT